MNPKSRLFAIIAVAALALSACASTPEANEIAQENTTTSEQETAANSSTEEEAGENQDNPDADATDSTSVQENSASTGNSAKPTDSNATADSSKVNDAILENIDVLPTPADIPGKPSYVDFNSGVTKLLEATMTGTGQLITPEALKLWSNCVSAAAYPTLSVEYTKLLASGDVEAVTSFTDLSEADSNAFYTAWTGCNVSE